MLLDDHALPDFDDFVDRVGRARTWGRPVAVHCVTAGELALSLAVLTAAGARPGDRIEHGGVIPAGAIPQLRDLGLTVVTQSAFIRERGDRYTEVEAGEQDDLYRCASLRAAGVPVAQSQTPPTPRPTPGWGSPPAAIDRRSAAGRVRRGQTAGPGGGPVAVPGCAGHAAAPPADRDSGRPRRPAGLSAPGRPGVSGA